MTRVLARRLALIFVAIAAVAGASADARPVTDCPLRNAPFSADTPLINILLSPAATAVVSSHEPKLLAQLPPMMKGTNAPSFAAIVTLREVLGFFGKNEQQIATIVAPIDADLRRLPVSAGDKVARCERYDNDQPKFTIPAGHPRLLLFEKINGFRDTPSVTAAHAAFLDLASRNGWTIVTTDKGGAITSQTLRKFDAVIWNNISGDVLTLAQRAALKTYIEHGGGFIGVHGSAGDPVYWWDWYVDTLIGARFEGHPFPNQFQKARVVIDNPNDPLAQGLPHEWSMTDEWYSFKTNPRVIGAHILAALDESTYAPQFMRQNLRMGDHPIAWSHCVGPKDTGGRVFYSAIGHRPEMYTDPIYQRMLTNAIAWAAQRDGHRCEQPQ